MPDTEHTHTAAEFRAAVNRLLDICMDSEAIFTPDDYIESLKEVGRLASGPCKEERLMVEEVQAEDALLAAIENAETEDDFEEEEYQDAVSWADRSSEARAEHARSLKAAQGKEETDAE